MYMYISMSMFMMSTNGTRCIFLLLHQVLRLQHDRHTEIADTYQEFFVQAVSLILYLSLPDTWPVLLHFPISMFYPGRYLSHAQTKHKTSTKLADHLCILLDKTSLHPHQYRYNPVRRARTRETVINAANATYLTHAPCPPPPITEDPKPKQATKISSKHCCHPNHVRNAQHSDQATT